jgi:hypothetical protein
LARTAQLVLQHAVPNWLFDFNSLIAMENDLTAGDFPAESGEWPHRWAEESDLELLTQGGLSANEVRALFAQGGRAALCGHDGKLITYTWYQPDGYTVFGWLRISLDHQVYSTATFVAPEFRGRRIHSQTRYFAYAALSDLGYTGIVALIEHLDRSALRAGQGGLRRYIGRLTYVRLLGLVIYRLDDKWGAGLWNRARPFELSFDVFDRDGFRLEDRHARSGLDGPPDPGSQ